MVSGRRVEFLSGDSLSVPLQGRIGKEEIEKREEMEDSFVQSNCISSTLLSTFASLRKICVLTQMRSKEIHPNGLRFSAFAQLVES